MTKLQSEGLEQQFRLRSVVDNHRELSGRALVLVAPTGEGGRGWLVRKLQSLLKKEFAEREIDKDPPGGGRPRPRKPRYPRSKAESCAEGGAW